MDSLHLMVQLNNLPCSVEDYVYDDFDTTKGQQVMQVLIIYLQKLYGIIQHKVLEFNDRYVVYNYGER